MNIELIRVRYEDKEILRNLLEKYDYEFSQYDQRDVNNLGLFGYKYLDHYWTDENRYAFFIIVESRLAGFVMVNEHPEIEEEATDHSIAEFFVMYKYRQRGVGKYAAFSVFDMFPGKWQLKRHPKNIPSVYFWDKVIEEYTNGNFRLIEANPGANYPDGSFGDILLFDNSI